MVPYVVPDQLFKSALYGGFSGYLYGLYRVRNSQERLAMSILTFSEALIPLDLQAAIYFSVRLTTAIVRR